MRVLVICEHFEPSTDACSKRMTTIVDRLVECGHHVRVLASETSLVDENEGFVCRPYVDYYSAYRMDEKTPMKRLRNNLSELANSRKAANELDRFDCVVVTTPPLLLVLSALSIAERMDARLVLDVRDVWPDVAYEMGSFRPGSLYGRTFERIARKAYARASLITAVTPGKVAKLREKLPEGEQEKVALIPNGFDLAFLEQEEGGDVIERQMAGDAPTCVYVGNLGFAQGLTSLLCIAERFPDVRFLLFGTGAEETLLAKQINGRDLANVRLCGKVGARDACAILRRADCAYVPLVSSDLRDSVPTKLYEALGCGCPVLLAARGDSVSLLDEVGLGYSAAPEDGEGLARAFEKLLATKWTERQKDTAAARIASRHSRQAAAKDFEALLAERFAGEPRA